MATYTKLPLSGSVDGKRILITSTTSGSATPIHTVNAGSASLDESWIYAYNDSSSSMVVSFLWGGTVEPNDVIRANITSRSGRVLTIDGMLLQNGLTIKAYATSGSVVSIDGFVNRISQ